MPKPRFSAGHFVEVGDLVPAARPKRLRPFFGLEGEQEHTWEGASAKVTFYLSSIP